MSCPQVRSCPLFPMFTRQAFLKVWQDTYCEGDHTRCARFALVSEGKSVPLSLLPNGKHLTLPKDKGGGT